MFIVVQKRVIQKWKLKFTVQSTVCRDWLGTAFLFFLSWCFQRWRRIMVSSLSLCSEEFWGPWFGFFFPFLSLPPPWRLLWQHMHVPSYFAFVTVWVPDSEYLCLVTDFCMHYFLGQKKEREGDCVIFMSLSWLKVREIFEEQKEYLLLNFNPST